MTAVNPGCYPKAVLHKLICNPRVQLETFVSAPYIILSIGLHGKIEPCSTCRGNSRASLLTDTSWKLASYFGWNPRFFSSFPTTLIKKKKTTHLFGAVLKPRKSHWRFASISGVYLWSIKMLHAENMLMRQKISNQKKKKPLEYLREGKDLVLLCKRKGCKPYDTSLGSWCLTQKLNSCRNEVPRALRSCVITVFRQNVY